MKARVVVLYDESKFDANVISSAYAPNAVAVKLLKWSGAGEGFCTLHQHVRIGGEDRINCADLVNGASDAELIHRAATKFNLFVAMHPALAPKKEANSE